MGSYDDILETPDYFDCERFKIRMRKIVCVARQGSKYQSDQERGFFKDLPWEIKLSFEICRNCEQGRMIKSELEHAIRKPRRGEGSRNLECEHYDRCLSEAAEKDWKSFKCDGCAFSIEGNKVLPFKKENTRICEECREKETISPKHALCARCLGGKARKGKKGPKSPHGTADGENATSGIAKAEISLPRGDMEVVISFKKHASILTEIKQLAEREFRSVEMQVLFALKIFLENDGDRDSIQE